MNGSRRGSVFALPAGPSIVRDQYRMRLNEILNLRWEEVDLENRVVKMLVQKNRRMPGYIIDPGLIS